MDRSTGSFSKNRDSEFVDKSANTFTSNRSSSFISKSVNTLGDSGIVKGISNGWQGDNVTSNEYGADDSQPYGNLEWGGVKHFEKIKDRS